MTAKTAGSATFTATDITDGSKTANTSPATTINAGAFAKLQILMPGETASPGSGTGKTGSPSAQTAGTSFNVTVNAVDANWNPVSVTDTVGITSSDANAALPANAALVAGTKTFAVTAKTAGTATFTSTDITDGSKTANTSPATTINAGAFAKLQILMPGETAAPGTGTGKTGSPSAQTAGTSFNATVNAVDANWNPVSVTDTVGITSSDANAALPANAALVAGTKTFAVTAKTAGSATFTSTDITDGSKTANTSPATTINAGAFAKLQLLMPGETAAPGTASGKTGSPSAQTAGTSFNVTVNAVDASWNPVSVTDTVGITSSDANATLPANAALVAGTKTFSVTAKTAGSATFTSTDITDGSKTANTSPATTINAGAFSKLQILMPGETAAPGTGTGKTGSPSAQTAGTSFNVTVNAVDANWNPVTSVTDTAGITSSDANAGLPANAALVAGTKTFSVTAKTAGSATFTATDISDGSKTANTSPATTINAGAFAKLQLLMPGETAAPGTASGKTGAPSAQTAGTSFNVTVNAVDANWNPVSSTDTVGITSSDGAATLPSNAALVAGTKTFSVTANTAGTATFTSTDITNGAKTPNTSPSTTINAGAASTATSTISAAPGSITANGSTTSTVTVQLKDALGNNVPASGGTVALGTTSGSLGSVTDNSDGTYTATLTSATTTGTATVTGTLNSSALASSASVTFTPGPATSLQVTISSPQTAGVAASATVTAKDAHGNTATGYTGTVTFSSTDGSAVLPGNYTFLAGDNGSHTFGSAVTLKTAGAQTVTATDTVTGSINGTSGSITVNPAGAATLQVTPAGTSQTAGTAFNVTVTAKDAFNNTATGYTGTVHFISTDPAPTLPGNYTFVGGDSGTKTFSVTLNTTGSRTVTATDTVTGSINGTTAAITVNAGAASTATSTISASPGSITANGSSTSTITVQLKDALGNNLAGSGGTVTLGTTAGSLGSVTDNANGTYTATLTSSTTAGTATITGTLNASALSNSTSVAFVAGPATKYIVTSSSYSPIAGSAVTITAQLADVNNNPVSTSGLTVTWSNTGAGGSFGSGTSTTNGSGVATVSFTTSTTAGTIHTVKGDDGTDNGTTSNITTVPAGPVKYIVTSSSYSPVAGTAVTITAQLADSNNNPVTTSGLVVTWSKTGTGGNFSTGTSTTNSSGIATVTFTTSTTAGTVHTVTGDDGTDNGTTSNITTVPGAAATLTVNGTPGSVTAGTAASVTVTAKDGNGNVATGYVGTVHFTSTDGPASLPGDYTFVAGDNGVHTFSGAYTLKTVGSQTLTATDTVTGSITGTSGGITVNPAAAATLVVSGNPASVTAGTPATVTVTALDAFNNTATGYTGIVHFSSSDAAAALPANYTFLAGDNGVHTFTNGVTLKTVGSRTVTATDTLTGTITGTSSATTVTPAAAATLLLNGTPGSVVAGTSANVTITAKDAYNNTATGYTGQVNLTSSDPAAGLPADYTFVAGDNGVHTLAATLKTVGSRTLTATDTGNGTINGTSAGITVNPAPAATLDLTTSGSTTAGNSLNITITARDSFGNIATGYTGTTNLTSTDAAATLPGNYTFTAGDNGTHTLAATLKTTGPQTVTATDTITATITGTTPAITVNPAAAATLVVSGNPASITAGTAATVTVTALDAYNNVATGYTGTVHFTSSDGPATLPANYTFVAGDNGIKTFTNGVTLKTVG